MGFNIQRYFFGSVIIIKGKRILLSVLLFIVILVTALVIWQWENITALFMGITSTEEELSVKREENDKIITSTLEKYPEISVRDLTEEEKTALAEGRITKDESLLLLQGKLTLEELLQSKEVPPSEPPEDEAPKEETPPQDTPVEETPVTPPAEKPKEETPAEKPKEETPVTPPPTPTTPSADEEIANLVGEMYILKSEFTSALKNLESTSLAAYAALSNEEKKLQKGQMMTEILDKVAVMEKDCDTQVKAILDRLTVLLNESGKDLTLVESIKTAYNNEKTITKAEYINTYFK